MDANQDTHDSPLPMAKPKGDYTPQKAVEIGYKLLMLKTACTHGEFLSRLEVLGFSRFEASRLMRAARMFHGSSSEQLLEAVETVSKLNELLVLEADEIATLKGGGEVLGLTLNSIKSMTVIQVRAAIRGVAYLRVQASLTVDEQRVLREYRERTKDVQDVIDKNARFMPSRIDLFSQIMGGAS